MQNHLRDRKAEWSLSIGFTRNHRLRTVCLRLQPSFPCQVSLMVWCPFWWLRNLLYAYAEFSMQVSTPAQDWSESLQLLPFVQPGSGSPQFTEDLNMQLWSPWDAITWSSHLPFFFKEGGRISGHACLSPLPDGNANSQNEANGASQIVSPRLYKGNETHRILLQISGQRTHCAMRNENHFPWGRI